MMSKLGRKMIVAIFVLVTIFWGLGKASDLGLINEIMAGIILDFLKIGIPIAAIWAGIEIYNHFRNNKNKEWLSTIYLKSVLCLKGETHQLNEFLPIIKILKLVWNLIVV